MLVNVDVKVFTSGELSSPLRGIGSAPGSVPGLAAHHEQGGEGSVDDGAIRVQHEPLRVLPVGQVGGVGPRVLEQVADQAESDRSEQAGRAVYSAMTDMAELDAAIPLGRMAEPKEIADLVVWLASDQASYVTATTFFVDGGIMQSSPGL